MTDIFKESIDLMNKTLSKMYLKEEDEKFISVAEQNSSSNPSNPGSNFFTDKDEIDPDKEQEKNKLMSQVTEKIKQSLKVSDELQSILNRIKKINDDINTNEWKINEEDNTAILRNKNARIFKQNENLCLSHNGKIEIFKSVPELHEWLKKNNYPLPHNISLHESILNEADINRTEGWQEIKDLVIKASELQLALNNKNQELYTRQAYENEHAPIDDNGKKIINNKQSEEIKKLTQEQQDLKKEIEDNNQAILDIYKKYNAEPGTWDPNYQNKKIELPKSNYSKAEEKNIWDDDPEETGDEVEKTKADTVSRLDTSEFASNPEDRNNTAVRFKARFNNTAWGPILKGRWDKLGDTQSWTPEDAEAHKKEYISHMNPNARGMGWAQEKDARKWNNIHYTKNDNVPEGLEGIAPKMVWNDLAAGKDAFSLNKNESSEDNQITDDEIWYLEYQIDDKEDSHYLNSNWRDEDLISDNLETAAKFTSREDAINELKELYSIKKLPFPLKPVSGLKMTECGTTCAGLGSAVQYLGKKKDEITESRKSDVIMSNHMFQDIRKNGIPVSNDGQILGKVGKTVAEYVDEAVKKDIENGFTSLYNGARYDNNQTNTHIYFDPNKLTANIVFDENNQPIGLISKTLNKEGNYPIYDLRGKEKIGMLDQSEAFYKYLGDTSSEEIIARLENAKKSGFDTISAATWRGDKDRIKILNKKGELNDKFVDLFNSEPFNQLLANPQLQANPELIYPFIGHKEMDQQALNNRIAQVNDIFGLTLDPNEPVLNTSKSKGHNREEFLKWREQWFKPIFEVWKSRMNKRDENIVNQLNNREAWNQKQAELQAQQIQEPQDLAIMTQINGTVDDMNQKLLNGEMNIRDLKKQFINILKDETISNQDKKALASKIYNTVKEYYGDDDIAGMLQDDFSQYYGESTKFRKYLLKILTEADSPADFADGPANITSNMAAATTGATDTTTISTTQDSNIQDIGSDDLDGYGPEDTGSSMPSFGDININSGSGISDEEPMIPNTKNERIVDVLVNENDLSQIKVKVKDLDTDKIEVRNLNEIDV